MTVKEIKEIINDLDDNIEIEINSIYNNEEWESSPICEVHYCQNSHKIYITPMIISV